MFGPHDLLRPQFLLAAEMSRASQEGATQTAAPPCSAFADRVIEHTSSMICGRGADDTIFFVNTAYCRFFGIAKTELIGSRWLPPVVRPDKSVLDHFSSPTDTSTTCLRLVENDQQQIVPLLVEYIGMVSEEGSRAYCSIARRPIHEHNRLSTVYQNERFNDFRIAQKEQTIRALALSVAEAQEQERRRIAIDLHDDIGQMLYLLRMKIDGMRETPDRPDTIEESLAILDQIIAKTRSMTADIGSRILQDFGLSQAIRVVADDIGQQYAIAFDVTIDALPEAIPDTVQSITYRIVRELLFNIVKHARATMGTVHVLGGAGFIKVDIADNGVPQPAMVDADRFGFGLRTAKEQIELVGGVFLIKRSPALGGMHVQFVIPTATSEIEPGR